MADFTKAEQPPQIETAQVGAYMEPEYWLRGMEERVLLKELLQYLLENINAAPGGGGGLEQYEAQGLLEGDNRCYVTCTEEGCTFSRTGGGGQNTEGTIAVPAGAILRGFSVHFLSAQAPGNTYYLNIDYQETGKAVNGSENSVMPPWATVTTKPNPFSDGSPATNYVHSGTPLQVGIVQVDDNGTRTRVRIKITNYNQQAGSNASILSVILP